MSNTEKAIVKKLEKALPLIPDTKKDYFVGFAEGVEAANKAQQDKKKPTDK